MIVCVCLSPALDITYAVPRFDLDATNRVAAVTHRPGGKAVNVAHVLQLLGEPVRLVVPVGGRTGAQLTADLAGLDTIAIDSGVETRRTVAIVDGATGQATMLVEPATIDCWDELRDAVGAMSRDADVLVVSGTQPAGVPDDAVARLVASAPCRTIVDTSGPALIAALAAGPTLVKPNAAELAEVGLDAASMAEKYGTDVVASHGADGVVASLGGNVFTARPGAPLVGNPTGAGDALVAGLARGLRTHAAPRDLLRDAVALSAAAVRCPHAGEVDLDEYRAQLDSVTVTP